MQTVFDVSRGLFALVCGLRESAALASIAHIMAPLVVLVLLLAIAVAMLGVFLPPTVATMSATAVNAVSVRMGEGQ